MRRWLVLALLNVSCGGQSPSDPPHAPTPGYLVYLRDREGSVLAAVDDQGKTLSLANDDGFGLSLSGSGTPIPREFLDKELDEETGYYHFQARYYDPATAQWIPPDPKLLGDLDCSARVQGCQPYAFAGNRPLDWTDEDGREILAFRDADGTPTLIITAGFYGPCAEAARDVFLQGVLNVRGAVRVIAWTAVYKTAAEVPNGLTKVEADPLYVRQDGAHSSETDGNLGGIHLSLTALDGLSSELGRAAEMFHEFMHAAGHISEGYFTVGSPYSKPGHLDGFGGNYWKNEGAAHFTSTETRDLLAPEAPSLVNGTSSANDTSFLSSSTLKVATGGANLPEGAP